MLLLRRVPYRRCARTLARTSATLLLACVCTTGAAAQIVQLRPGDALRLAVKDEPALAGDYPVLANGDVLLPIAGLVKATDAPFDQVAARVRALLARQLAEPVVVLVPLVRVTVLGEARHPGVFLVDPTQRWSDVLALAGGALPTASPDAVRLTQPEGNAEQRLRVRDLSAYAVRSGDQLLISRRSWFRENSPILVSAATSVLVAALTTILIR